MRWAMAVAVGLVFCAFVSVRAADEKPAADATPAAASDAGDKAIKLTKPWSQITSLSEEQKVKIDGIHKKANEEVKEIRDKEKADIMAILTDDQKTELKSAGASASAEKKMADAEKASVKDEAAAKKEETKKEGGN